MQSGRSLKRFFKWLGSLSCHIFWALVQFNLILNCTVWWNVLFFSSVKSRHNKWIFNGRKFNFSGSGGTWGKETQCTNDALRADFRPQPFHDRYKNEVLGLGGGEKERERALNGSNANSQATYKSCRNKGWFRGYDNSTAKSELKTFLFSYPSFLATILF